MLEVTVRRTIEHPNHQIFEANVILHGYDRLTPRAARGALEIAFGQPYGGEVWAPLLAYGYRVYKSSARKIFPDH